MTYFSIFRNIDGFYMKTMCSCERVEQKQWYSVHSERHCSKHFDKHTLTDKHCIICTDGRCPCLVTSAHSPPMSGARLPGAAIARCPPDNRQTPAPGAPASGSVWPGMRREGPLTLTPSWGGHTHNILLKKIKVFRHDCLKYCLTRQLENLRKAYSINCKGFN